MKHRRMMLKHLPTRASMRSLLLLAATSALVSFSAENFVDLPTELKVSSVGVSVRAPLGFRYRAGEAFPLELHVSNPGPATEVEISAVESDASSNGDWAEQGILQAAALPTGTTRFMLPMRAPSVSASITLTLRGGTESSGKAELFRASLSRLLHPLPSVGRVVVFCGSGSATVWPQDQAARLSAKELPVDGWMWESIDWVVMSDASIQDAPPEALRALRLWLLGGGRLFLRSREALIAALKVRLLPLELSGDIPADLNWWEKNAGLKKEDVLASKNFRPVYARLKSGFGQIVFLFPGSQAADADEAAVFNRGDLQRHRAVLPDQRIQTERFAAFVPAAPSDPRRRTVMLWASLGALIFCAGIFYARTSRSKLEALAVPFGTGALLTALLNNGFQQHELTVSRMIFERHSADASALVRDEWTFLEAFRRPLQVSAQAPKDGIFSPRFDEVDDLRAARLTRGIQNERQVLDKIAVAPNQPAMLFANSVAPSKATNGKDIEISIRVSNTTQALMLPGGFLIGRRAIWISSNGTVLMLEKSPNQNEYASESFSARALELALAETSDAPLAKAHANAVSWAVNEAVKQSNEALIVWDISLQPGESPLISIQGAAANTGNDFLVQTIELKSR